MSGVTLGGQFIEDPPYRSRNDKHIDRIHAQL
jgi:hypothetical protein